MSDVFDSVKLASLPSASQRIKQNTFFSDLENICGECLDEADLLYVFATDGDRDYAKTNWKSPGDFQATEHNSPVFTINGGFTGNGTNSYLNTHWDPATNGVNFTNEVASCFVSVHTEITAGTKNAFGARDTGAPFRNVNILPKRAGSTHECSINGATASIGAAVSSIGFFQCQSRGAIDARFFKDGVQVGGVDTEAKDAGLTSTDITILCEAFGASRTGFIDAEVGIFGVGPSFEGQESALYTAWNNYFTSL